MLLICNKRSKNCDITKCSHKEPHEKHIFCNPAAWCGTFGERVNCIPYDLEYIMKEVIKEHEEKK
jgi:hypothetical protein